MTEAATTETKRGQDEVPAGMKRLGEQAFRPEVLDPDAMGAALERLGIDAPDGVEERAAKLGDHYLQLRRAKKIATPLLFCETCGGGSPASLDACPFCGDSDAEENAGQSAAPAAAEEPEQEAAPESEPEEPVTEAAGEITEPGKILDGAAPDEEAKPAKRKPGRPKKNGAALAVTSPPPAAVSKKNGLRPGPKSSFASAAAGREKDLDEAVGRIQTLQRQGVKCLWQLGIEIKAIYDSELWMARSAEGSTKGQRYKAFDQFIRMELGITAATAFDQMKIAKEFTAEQVNEIGTSKLHAILQAPEAKRAELVEKAKKGASKKKIRAEVKAANAEAGRGRKRAKKTVTAIQVGESFRVDLRDKRGPGKPRPDAEVKLAKKIVDGVWGQHEMANGLVMQFRLKNGPKGWQLFVWSKRVDEE